MRIVNIEVAEKFLKKHRTAVAPITAWINVTRFKLWSSYQELKNDWPKINPIGVASDPCRIVFKLGTSWRIDTVVLFSEQIVFIKRVGSHEEYNKWTYNS